MDAQAYPIKHVEFGVNTNSSNPNFSTQTEPIDLSTQTKINTESGDEKNFDDDDWWKDMTPSDIIIKDDGTIYRIIKDNLEKNIRTGDVRHNGVVYPENKIHLNEDANEMYVECGYILRRDGYEENTLYLVNVFSSLSSCLKRFLLGSEKKLESKLNI